MPTRRPLGGPTTSYKSGPKINDGKHNIHNQAHPGTSVGGQHGFTQTPIIRSPVDLDVPLTLRASGASGSNQNEKNIGTSMSHQSSAPKVSATGKGAPNPFDTANKGKKLY